MNKFSFDLFEQMPIVGIMRNVPSEHIQSIAAIYQRSGLTCLEVTMNSPGAEEAIMLLSEVFTDKLNIGAGTVCSLADLEKAIAAGAGFIVTPIINEEVIRHCVGQHIPIFPGANTPSEIYKAWSLGATLIKLFPAGDMKPSRLNEILAPLNFVSLMPTGGVRPDNFTEWFAQGAKAVGMGSHLFPKEIIAAQDWTALSAIYASVVKKYRDFVAGDEGEGLK